MDLKTFWDFAIRSLFIETNWFLGSLSLPVTFQIELGFEYGGLGGSRLPKDSELKAFSLSFTYFHISL